MEKAWEFAVVNGQAFTDWSSRHTRLRYQSVLFSLFVFMAAVYGIKELNLPTIIKFEKSPSKIIIHIGLLAFASYSIVSFKLQHSMESRNQPNFIREFKIIIEQLKRSLYGQKESLHELFKVAKSKLDRIDKSNILENDMRIYEEVSSNLSNKGDWEYYIHLFLETKEELNKISPGFFSIGNQVVSNLQVFEKALSNLCDDLNQFVESRDEQLIAQIDLNMFGLQQESKEIPDKLLDLHRDLHKFSKSKYVHTTLLPYTIPLFLSVFMTAIGLLIFLFKLLHGKL